MNNYELDGQAAQLGPLVYRQISLGLPAFARLKEWQRHFQKLDRRKVSNSETVSRLILNNPPPPRQGV